MATDRVNRLKSVLGAFTVVVVSLYLCRSLIEFRF